MANLARFTLSIGAAALFAGCGGAQLPINAPGVMPQGSGLAASPNSTKYRVVYRFRGSPDGQNPLASLIDVKGTLYGVTGLGGVYCPGSIFRCGTVFSITTDGTEKVLHSFGKGTDGSDPVASLIDVKGTLYGTTSQLGSYGLCRVGSGGGQYVPCGTVFSITPSGTEKVLHNFGSKIDGLDPAASLIDVKGTLYGTTENGGTSHLCQGAGCGTVFSVTPSGTEKVLHRFVGYRTDGAIPVASLIDVKGTLYGTTQYGGAYGGGAVFSITLSGTEKVLHSFGKGTDGYIPSARLIDVDGTLYGTTEVGGRYIFGGRYPCNQVERCGTVFSITPSGTEKVLHRFVGKRSDGAAPVAPLIDVNGTLYGTTQYGGAFCEGTAGLLGGCGTIFSITPSGAEKVLHSFGSGTDGLYPAAALTDVDGALYGTTLAGAREKNGVGKGTVFAFKP